jgi:hypothetical protein
MAKPDLKEVLYSLLQPGAYDGPGRARLSFCTNDRPRFELIQQLGKLVALGARDA